MASEEGARVLVVDDVSDIAEAVACLLQIDGYIVQTANSGEQALRLIEEFRPHCVLLDVSMPGMDGLELTRNIRRRYGNDIVLIAMTGSTREDVTTAQTFERVDHYLQKPIDASDLRKVLPPL